MNRTTTILSLLFPVLTVGGMGISAQVQKQTPLEKALEKPFYDAGACRAQDQAVWAYGWNFALLAALQCSSNAKESIIKKQFQKVRQLERAVGVVTPDYFIRKENKVKNSLATLIYFTKGPGFELGKTISKKLGFRAGAMFELAIKEGFLLILYGPNGTKENNSLLKAIERSALVAGIPDRLVAPLRKGIQTKASYKTVKALIFSHALLMRSYLRGEKKGLRPVMKNDQMLPAIVRDMVTPFLNSYSEAKNPEIKSAYKFRGSMFRFGIDLCTASFQVAQGQDASASLKKLKTICKILGVQFPAFVGIRGEPFDDLKQGNQTKRILQATSFLIKGKAPQLVRAIGAKRGLGHGASAVEMGIKAFLSSRYQRIVKKHAKRMDQEFERLGRKMHLPARTIVKFQDIYREDDGVKRAKSVFGLIQELRDLGEK